MIIRLKADFPIAWLCRRLSVSRSGYHRWLAVQVVPSRTEQRRNELTELVTAEFIRSKYAAGRRTITTRLRKAGMTVNGKLVGRIMREEGLIPAATIRARKKHRDRQLRATDPADLLQRDFTADAPGQKLVGAITQIRTGEGWVYLATVIDLFDRQVIGYTTASHARTGIVINAFTTARRAGLLPDSQVIFHSDHGTQYASKRFIRYTRRNRITRSMGEKFECWDNAVAESFFSRLKNERLHNQTYTTRADAITAIEDYIRYYNHIRPHGTLGGNTPTEHRATWTPAA